jgi:membrane protein DedA with SNARE-associated domain
MSGTKSSQSQVEPSPGKQTKTHSKIAFWLTYSVATVILMAFILVLPAIFFGTILFVKDHPLHPHAMIVALVVASVLGEVIAKMVAQRIQR